MYAKILVPVDGSEASTQALQEAIRMVKERGGKLRLLHVVKAPILDYAFGASDSSRDEVMTLLRKAGNGILAKAEAQVRHEGLTADCLLFESAHGGAAPAILDQANHWPADLIAMGSHPQGTLIGIGSDTTEVVSESKVPVLLVRGPALPSTAKMHRPLIYSNAACDRSSE